MSLGLNKTKRRIQSVKSTKKITKAMEMVATVKLKRFRSIYEDGTLYSRQMADFMAKLFSFDKQAGSHYGKVNANAIGNLYIVITSDLGLCAGYNNELFKFVDGVLTPMDTIAPIGSKGVSHFTHDEKYQRLSTRYSGVSLDADMMQIHQACEIIKDQFNQGTFKKIFLVYTKYINSLRCEPATFQLLPIEAKALPKGSVDSENPPIFEPSARTMIHELLPQYLAAACYSKLVEAQVSEQASRRNAMEAANDNADDLISKLTIEYNKARQGAITQEITEVVSGSNAQNN